MPGSFADIVVEVGCRGVAGGAERVAPRDAPRAAHRRAICPRRQGGRRAGRLVGAHPPSRSGRHGRSIRPTSATRSWPSGPRSPAWIGAPTGRWIQPDPERRVDAVLAWGHLVSASPTCSVNVHEKGWSGRKPPPSRRASASSWGADQRRRRHPPPQPVALGTTRAGRVDGVRPGARRSPKACGSCAPGLDLGAGAAARRGGGAWPVLSTRRASTSTRVGFETSSCSPTGGWPPATTTSFRHWRSAPARRVGPAAEDAPRRSRRRSAAACRRTRPTHRAVPTGSSSPPPVQPSARRGLAELAASAVPRPCEAHTALAGAASAASEVRRPAQASRGSAAAAAPRWPPVALSGVRARPVREPPSACQESSGSRSPSPVIHGHGLAAEEGGDDPGQMAQPRELRRTERRPPGRPTTRPCASLTARTGRRRARCPGRSTVRAPSAPPGRARSPSTTGATADRRRSSRAPRCSARDGRTACPHAARSAPTRPGRSAGRPRRAAAARSRGRLRSRRSARARGGSPGAPSAGASTPPRRPAPTPPT